jgi:hypothetical protein
LYLKQQQEVKHRLEYEQKLKALNDRKLYMKQKCDALQQHFIDQQAMELDIEEQRRSCHEQCIANDANAAARAQSQSILQL